MYEVLSRQDRLNETVDERVVVQDEGADGLVVREVRRVRSGGMDLRLLIEVLTCWADDAERDVLNPEVCADEDSDEWRFGLQVEWLRPATAEEVDRLAELRGETTARLEARERAELARLKSKYEEGT